MRPFCFVLVILSLIGMAHAGEPKFDIPRQVILEAWKKNAQVDSSIREGVEYTVEFSGGKKRQVSLDARSLIIQGEMGLMIHTAEEVRVFTRKKTLKEDPFQFLKLARNGKEYEYLGKITKKTDTAEKEESSFSERIRMTQEYLGDVTTCFPFVVPEEFQLHGRPLVADLSAALQRSCVEVQSTVRQNDGTVQLVYVENDRQRVGSRRAWQRVTLTLDPRNDYRVEREDWVSLDPASQWKGSWQYIYGPMFAKGPIVLRECRDEEQFQQYPAWSAGKFVFSQFRKSRLSPDRLKVSNFERDLPHDQWVEMPMHCGCCVWRRPDWLEAP